MKSKIIKIVFFIVVAFLLVCAFAINSYSDFEIEKELIESGDYEEALTRLRESEEDLNYLRTRNINHLPSYIEYSNQLAVVIELIGDVYREKDVKSLAINNYKRAKLLHTLIEYNANMQQVDNPEMDEEEQASIVEFAKQEQVRIQKKIDDLLKEEETPIDDDDDEEVGNIVDTDSENIGEVVGYDEDDEKVGNIVNTDSEDMGEIPTEESIDENDSVDDIEEEEEEEDTSFAMDDEEEEEEDTSFTMDDEEEEEEDTSFTMDDEEEEEEEDTSFTMDDEEEEEEEDIVELDGFDEEEELEISSIEFKKKEFGPMVKLSLDELKTIDYEEFYNKYLYLEYISNAGESVTGPQGLHNELSSSDYETEIDWQILKALEDGSKEMSTHFFIALIEETESQKPEYIEGQYIVQFTDPKTKISKTRIFNFYNDNPVEPPEEDVDDDEDKPEDDFDNTYDSEYIQAVMSLKSGGKITVELLNYNPFGIYEVRYLGDKFTLKESEIKVIVFNIRQGDDVELYLDDGSQITGRVTKKEVSTVTILSSNGGRMEVSLSKIKFAKYVD